MWFKTASTCAAGIPILVIPVETVRRRSWNVQGGISIGSPRSSLAIATIRSAIWKRPFENPLTGVLPFVVNSRPAVLATRFLRVIRSMAASDRCNSCVQPFLARDLLRLSGQSPDQAENQQPAGKDHARDQEAHPCRRSLPGWQILPEPGCSQVAPYCGNPMGHPEVHEHDPLIRGSNPRSRRCITKSAKDSGHYRGLPAGLRQRLGSPRRDRPLSWLLQQPTPTFIA